MKKQSNGLL